MGKEKEIKSEEEMEKEFMDAEERAIVTGERQEISPRYLGLDEKIVTAFVNPDGIVDGYDSDGKRSKDIF